ncbi:MAG: 3-phosphoshikimate 1-carboxyvinyltransferase [Proteobacteria bacterium]|nr:3-phosphoshikimate 1-carboxyvinyltransferase [Pseudomonadota bacterium]MDA1332461.1 3-phosphoshikimate 1-carboxyvinyltransferase [Pseudomonadota bacterium]
MILSRDDQKITLGAPYGAAGTVVIPGSKSISNRGLILAALSTGVTELKGLLHSDDTRVMIDALRTLGLTISVAYDTTSVTGCGGVFPNQIADLFLGNAGTAVRSLVPVLALGQGQYDIRGVPRMHERPIGDLVDALTNIGANISYENQKNFLPLRVKKSNRLKFDAPIEVRGDVSSQFLSGLLLSLPLLGRGVSIKVTGILVSKPYVQMTLDLMKLFGVSVQNVDWAEFHIDGGQVYRSPGALEIEVDVSSASYFFAAGLLGGGPIVVQNISQNSIQGDIQFLDVLSRIGADVSWTERGVSVSMPKNNRVKAFNLDLNHIPDAAMTLAVIALFADGPCELRNIENWRIKETDRLSAMATELRKLGATVNEGVSSLEIEPPTLLTEGVCIDTYDDHRMAMCFSLACFAGLNITINNPLCVNKTFPDYFDILESVLQAPVVTIDGPSGSGKGTVGKKTAERLGFSYLDSGALYRGIGLCYLDSGANLDLDDSASVETFLNGISLEFSGGLLFVNGEDVSRRIREEEVSMAASKVAKSEAIRSRLYRIQRSVRRAPGLVAEGRDMGTTVFPDAKLKIFLTASLEERARRRFLQLVESNGRVNMEGLVAEMRCRDVEDGSRNFSPMRQAESAIELDSTGKSVDEVVQAILSSYREAGQGSTV